MKSPEREYYNFGDLVNSVSAFLNHLKTKWWLLLITAALSAGIAFVYYIFQKPKYPATCTFILEEKQGGLGGLGSIASQFGIDVGGLGGSSLFAGDNILDILKSNKIMRKTLLYKTADGGKTLADRYLDFSGLREKDEYRSISYGALKDTNMSLLADSLLFVIQQDLIRNRVAVERVSRKGTIISVTVTSPDQYFSKLLAEHLVEEARNMYVDVKAGTAQGNVRRLEEKADSILRQLNSRTYQVAKTILVDANPADRTLAVPSEINNREKTVLGAVYLEVIKNLELSKTLLSQQTPVIQILDSPQIPIKNKARSLKFLIVVFVFLGCAFFTVFSWIRFGIQQSKQQIQKES